MNALLGIDVGTSACKAAAFAENGEILAQATENYAVQYPRPGWAEQHPGDWWRAVCRAISKVLETVKPAQIASVGVDGQSWSAIAMNARGKVLAPTPIWNDTRARDICAEPPVQEEALFEVSGNPFQPGYTLPKILWYQKHLPEVYEKADKILQSNSYIVFRLTGEITQDFSQGYGLACFDLRNLRWDDALCEQLGIRKSLLPALFPCHQIVGQVTEEAARLTGLLAGTPVVAGGLDAACGTLGAGVIEPGQAQEQGGQAGGMSLCLGEYAADKRLILGAHVVPGRWLLQGGTTGGGGAMKWLRETICPELSFSEMSALAENIPAGSEGLIFLPYMAGERSPIWNPRAKGVFFGLDYAKSRAHMIRAVMEGVAYALRHNLEVAESAGARISTLRAMGGSANSLVWTQIKADITGHAIEVPASDTATTLGAAMLAGVGIGAYASFEEAVAKTVKMHREHSPNAKNAALYAENYAKYREIYERLEPLMEEKNESGSSVQK